ncbi:MAG: S41 family peptidase [bacterium]
MIKKGFSLFSVLIIVVITALLSFITTGVILSSNYKSVSGLTYAEIMTDDYLIEFLGIYSKIKENFYGDYDQTGMMDAAINSLLSYEGKDSKDLIESAISGMLNYLGDDYTLYLNDDAYNYLSDELSGTYQGIGVSITLNEIISVTKDSPAEKVGIKKGDVITMVNSTKIDETNSFLISVIIGASTDDINITVLREEEELVFTVSKTSLDSSTTYSVVEDTNTGYIHLSVFSEQSFESFNSALTSLESEGIDNLIIDLRDNAGGYLDKSLEIASLFLEKGNVINSIVSNEGKEINYDETEESRDYGIVVLINEGTASASEILASALVDNNKALSVGLSSYGKGTVQQLVESSSGFSAKYTVAYWYTPNNICINETGIKPNYYVETEIVYDENENIIGLKDAQLEKALEILNET